MTLANVISFTWQTPEWIRTRLVIISLQHKFINYYYYEQFDTNFTYEKEEHLATK